VLPTETDIFIAACGYEGRACAAAEKFNSRAKKLLALGFLSQQELDYEENSSWFKSAGFDLIEVIDCDFRNALDAYFLENISEAPSFRLELDISCFNRFRLGHLVDALRNIKKEAISVTFHYSIAEFTPPQEDAAPTVTVEPVIPEFAGWTTRPDRPPAAIVGLGYEPNKAIGIIDHFEINNATWAYYPLGPIPEYYQKVLNANQSLLTSHLLESFVVADRCQLWFDSWFRETSQFHERSSQSRDSNVRDLLTVREPFVLHSCHW